MPKPKTPKTSPAASLSISGALETGLLNLFKVVIASMQANDAKAKKNAAMQEEAFRLLSGYFKRIEERDTKMQAAGPLMSPMEYDKRLDFFHPVTAPDLKPAPGFSDDRGLIINLAEHTVGGVQAITSKAGSKRAKHIHRSDSHVCYVVSGRIEYLEAQAKMVPRKLNDGRGPIFAPPFYELDPSAPVSRRIYSPGDRFVTGPGIAHQMNFMEDTVMVVCSEHPRDPKSYDEDIIKFDADLSQQ